MIRNYLKTSFRSLRRNLIYTLINIIGLGIGFSGVILTFILWRYDADFDRQQAPFENIFRINTTRTDENEEHQWGITPVPLAPELADEFYGIESWCRYGNSSLLLKYGDNTFNESVHYGDRNFFRFFNFPLAEGDASSFGQKYSAIISQDFSKKYFGQQPALGRMISVIRNDSVLFNLQVTGVLEKIPMNTSFHISIIVPYDVMHDVVGTDENDWNVSIPTVSYIRLYPDSDPSAVAGNLSHFVEKNNEILEDWKISRFYLTPFAKQKYESRYLIRGLTWAGLPDSALYGSIFMNIVILLIACFNFTNTAMAYARKRLKEIGIRKTFGGLKKTDLCPVYDRERYPGFSRAVDRDGYCQHLDTVDEQSMAYST
jgi:putative ABC transport system permease protein